MEIFDGETIALGGAILAHALLAPRYFLLSLKIFAVVGVRSFDLTLEVQRMNDFCFISKLTQNHNIYPHFMGLRNRFLYQEHSCFFVTTTCMNWISLIRQSDSYSILLDSLAFLCKKYDANVLGYVIMPNHIHMILYFRKGNHLSSFMRDFKKFTSVKIRQRLDDLDYDLKNIRIDKAGRVFKVWMDRFDEVYIRDRNHLEIKLSYIHNNPLQPQWCLVLNPEEYLYSSASYYSHGLESLIEIRHYMDYY